MAAKDKLVDLRALIPYHCKTEPHPEGLLVTAESEGARLRAEGAPDWEGANWLWVDVLTLDPWTTGIEISFWRKGNERAETPDWTITMAPFPAFRARLLLELKALDSQVMFQPRKPGGLKNVIFGKGIARDEVGAWSVGVQKNAESQRVILRGLGFSEEEPPTPHDSKTLVDEFGQNKNADWKGKTRSFEELSSLLRAELAEADRAAFPEGFSRYGGLSDKRFEATGFFRTEKEDGRWWFVDPEGCAFFSNGIDCVGPNVESLAPEIEELCDYIPPFPEARQTLADGRLRLDFAISNLARVFGEGWYDAWTRITRARLVRWGFNTVANWSDGAFRKNSGLPYVFQPNGFPDTKAHVFRDFPDVLSAEYRENAEAFARELLATKDDPLLIGYFMRNEPQWAFLGDLILAEEVLANPAPLACKAGLIAFLKEKYGEIAALNAAWRTSLGSFADLEKPIRHASELSDAAKDDLEAFSLTLIRAYVEIPALACKRADPNHLNLGMRYAYISHPRLLEGAENFDVFTVNCYQLTPVPYIERVAEFLDVPVLIGEVHHGAIDRGLPATGICGVRTQADRGAAYRYFYEQCAATPWGVGAHYFQWNDQSYLGRFDGENFQIGAVDVCGRPYEEFVSAAAACNAEIYGVKRGARKATDVCPEEIPRVGF